MLIGLPVLIATVGGTLIASSSESVEERQPALLGQAQAMVSTTSGRVEQSIDGESYSASGDQVGRTAQQAQRELNLLSGSTVVRVENGVVRALLDGRVSRLQMVKTDLADDVTRGIVAVTEGRLPASDSEAVVTEAVADLAGGLNSPVVADGVSLKIVGIGTIGTVGRHPEAKALAVLPSAPVQPRGQVDGDIRFLVDRDDPVTWTDVQDWNERGFVVTSRDVLANPPSADEQYAMDGFSGGFTAPMVLLMATGIVLEVVLLAGPAFAVSARRQRRTLALLAANGGGQADLRRVVIGQALAISIRASLGAGAVGVGLGALAWRFAPGAGLSMGPFDVPWMPIIIIGALGVVAAVLAALVPAASAARADVVASLHDREPQAKARKGWPLIGAVLVAVGIAGSFTGGRSAGGEMTIAVFTVATVFGAVLLTPWLISVAASTARWLPLPVRLALRDADRHRGRTAPAVAAIMASIAAVTAFGIASSSDAAQGDSEEPYAAPIGTVRLTASTEAMPAVIAAAEKASGATFTALGEAGTGSSSTSQTPVIVFRPDAGYPGSSSGVPVVVGDAATLAAWGVRLAADDLVALDAGQALVADQEMIRNGTVALNVGSLEDEGRQLQVPAIVADLTMGTVPSGPAPEIGGAIISAETAARLELPVTTPWAIADRPAGSFDHLPALRAAVLVADPSAGDVEVTRVQTSEQRIIILVLGVLGVVAILIGTFSATALALNDARGDLRTLAAVGARPRTRRLVTASMAYVLALLGAVIGVLVGFAPGLAATWPLTTMGGQSDPTIDVPWALLTGLIVVVPISAALVVAAVTRSRLPVAGRSPQ